MAVLTAARAVLALACAVLARGDLHGELRCECGGSPDRAQRTRLWRTSRKASSKWRPSSSKCEWAPGTSLLVRLLQRRLTACSSAVPSLSVTLRTRVSATPRRSKAHQQVCVVATAASLRAEASAALSLQGCMSFAARGARCLQCRPLQRSACGPLRLCRWTRAMTAPSCGCWRRSSKRLARCQRIAGADAPPGTHTAGQGVALSLLRQRCQAAAQRRHQAISPNALWSSCHERVSAPLSPRFELPSSRPPPSFTPDLSRQRNASRLRECLW